MILAFEPQHRMSYKFSPTRNSKLETSYYPWNFRLPIEFAALRQPIHKKGGRNQFHPNLSERVLPLDRIIVVEPAKFGIQCSGQLLGGNIGMVAANKPLVRPTGSFLNSADAKFPDIGPALRLYGLYRRIQVVDGQVFATGG